MRRGNNRWITPPGPVASGLKIGLLGGSFNPAHDGHVHIAETALKKLGLDYVWWLVSPQNPLKPCQGMATLARRLDFARAAARIHPRFVVMDIERELGTRYTIDTLTRLKRRFPQVRFVWLMGSDSLENFHRWKAWPRIVTSLPIAVVTRPESVLAMLHAAPLRRFPLMRKPAAGLARARPPAIALLDGPRNPTSSTAIRAASARGEVFVQPIPA